MKINKGSFYNTFTSKKALFEKTLQKYANNINVNVIHELQALNNPIEAIGRLLDFFLDQDSNGCFIINTAANLTDHDDEIKKLVQQTFNIIDSFLEEQIKLAIDLKQTPEHVNPKTAAKLLLTLMTGGVMLGRHSYKKSEIRPIKEFALQMLC